MPNGKSKSSSSVYSNNYYIYPSTADDSVDEDSISQITESSLSSYSEDPSVKVEYYSSLPLCDKTTKSSSKRKTLKNSEGSVSFKNKYPVENDSGDYGYTNVKSFYTGVTDLIYVPTERDHWEVAKSASKLKTLPSNASVSARYTAGLLSRSSNVILTPGAYVLAPGLAGCPDVVFEICPKAGVISIGSGKRVFFEFLNDDDVFVRFELERNPKNGMTFAENLIEKLWKNQFFWASEPVVVTAHLGNILAASGDMTNDVTGPFSSAIFYGAAEHGGPSSVVPRMAPCLGYFSDWESYCKTCVYCPFDVIMAIRMYELKSQVSFFDE
jgi:hypothetical protein